MTTYAEMYHSDGSKQTQTPDESRSIKSLEKQNIILHLTYRYLLIQHCIQNNKENVFSLYFTARICYHCDSRNEACPEDSVNGTSATTCSEGNDFCVIVKDDRHEETRFYRDCINKCDKELVDWSKDGEEYCKMCCGEDFCNVGRCSSNVFTPSYLFFVLSSIVAFRKIIV